MTSQAQSINSNMRRLRRRVRLLLVERGALFGAAGGCLTSAVVVLLSSRVDSLIDYRLWAAIVLVGAVAGGLYGLLRKLDDLTVALAADKRTGMRERLSTAVILDPTPRRKDPPSLPPVGGTEGGMERAVVNDAVGHISSLRASEVFRHRFGAPHVALGAALVVLAAAVFWPLIPAFQSQNRRAEVRVMKGEGVKLIKIAREIKRETGPKQAQMKKLASRLQDLGRKMQSGRLEKKKAMLQTRRLTKEVQKQQDQLARKNATTRSMDQAKLDMKKAAAELAKQMAMKLAAKGKMPPAEAMAKLPSDKLLAKLANKQGALTPSEQKALEEALSKYADPKNGMSIPKELGEALAKLAANKDYQKAMEIMQKLAQKLNMKSGGMCQMDREMLEKQLQALAKALKGTDLDKLAQMMRANAERLANMSPEELRKLIKELQEMQKMAQLMAKACTGCKKCGLGLCGLMPGMGIGACMCGPGGGFGADNRNTGPRKKTRPVKDLAKVPAAVGESGMVFSTGEVKGAPDSASPASVPYTEVLPDYKKAAENALAREKVPPAYRTRVKDYFGSLNR